jgi:hypothetical protein
MNPLSILTTLRAHGWLTVPLVLLIVTGCTYALFYGPRTYEATATYVLITPGMPSESDLERDPGLAQKADNPYLRSVDSSLAAQVVIARLGAADIASTLQREGLSTDYAALPANEFGSGQIVRISSSAAAPEEAVQTTARLGQLLVSELRSIQLIKGGSEDYFVTAQAVTPATEGIERVSSRLRTVVMLAVAGVVVLFGAVSLARAVEINRSRRRDAAGADSATDPVQIASRDPESGAHEKHRAINGVNVLSNSGSPHGN